ncbi:hypothetical protein BJ170DRAFT_133323 [Xylariales sp. AK1849]|nr:hypothetical protein BJ170DRAFT_133323 [Xylariales sp. AK1849]
MLSHTSTTSTSLPPILDRLLTYLPKQERREREDSLTPMSDQDPDMDRLLPRRRRQPQVRIQGRLAAVKSVSVVNLRLAVQSTSQRNIARLDAGVGSTSRRRRSLDDGSEVEEDTEDVEDRDTRLRGYGIGGAGNIRTSWSGPRI